MLAIDIFKGLSDTLPDSTREILDKQQDHDTVNIMPYQVQVSLVLLHPFDKSWIFLNKLFPDAFGTDSAQIRTSGGQNSMYPGPQRRNVDSHEEEFWDTIASALSSRRKR